MVGMAIFIALIVVLQTVATFIKFGPFSITLALVPIVVGAAMYGSSAGAVLGGAFGVVVLIYTITGADAGAYVLWTANPLLTAVLCLVKGILAGWLAGLVYAAISKKNMTAAAFCAAFVCPIVNTGIFIAAMIFLYRDTLAAWAGGANVIYYAFIGLTGINFLLEFGLNFVLGPVVARIVYIAKKGRLSQ